MLLVFHCCCYFGDIHWERRVQIGWWVKNEEVTSHPEEVLVTVVLVPFPVGCRVVTVVKTWRAGFAALSFPVSHVQEADQVLVALLLKPKTSVRFSAEIGLNKHNHSFLYCTLLCLISACCYKAGLVYSQYLHEFTWLHRETTRVRTRNKFHWVGSCCTAVDLRWICAIHEWIQMDLNVR